ncbi:hypothetical protein JRQ81_012778 [Phrynocephalus forsythii]|uniref:PET117 cytochrome c oxidase chaperone n=1 Tax=Phrynocephalus forsythii TaxID=171643 RepID=A0A9Q0Y1P9_9SAUR|nr:hypothetical protein JRQ81_012778 [Phrynocephalus forsythii]
MSGASRAVLGLSVVVTVGVVAGVHIQEKVLRQRLHEGVSRDLERQKLKGKAQQEQVGSTPQPEMERSQMLTVEVK